MPAPTEPLQNEYFVGFDPVARDNHSWAVIEVNGDDVIRITSGVAGSPSSALYEVIEHLSHPPKAVGVNAPLYWGADGDRKVDLSIRRRVIAMGGQPEVVPSVNSQLGAVLVRGVIVAQLATRTWALSKATEVNPKALLLLYPQANQFLYQQFSDPSNVRDRDAVVSAFAAWQGAIRQLDWRDLARMDRQAFMPVSTDVAYWFPLV
jgi:hypothetical protein